MKKIWIIPFVVLLATWSCKKHDVEMTKFPVTATQGNNSVTFSWSPITLSDFKNVTIYRSASPIDDPGFGKSIDASLQIGLISDKTVTSFIDSNMIMNSTGTSYYKVVVNFGNRFITSDLLTIVRNGFSVIMSNNSGSVSIVRFPEIHKLYYIDYSMGTLRAVDYITKTVSNSIPYGSSNGLLPVPAINNGNPELFIYYNNNIYCYNANTLALKYSFSMPYSLESFCVKNNYLYAAVYGSSLYTYDLNTKTMIDSKSLASGIYGSSLKVFAGPNNAISLRYYNDYYNSNYGQYFYVNTVEFYRIANGVPIDSARMNAAVINQDSTYNNSYNYNYINLSPDGKYAVCDNYGNMYSIFDHTLHNVMSSSNSANISFSEDGQYLVARPQQTFGTYSVSIFSLPSFTLSKTMRSGNTGSSNALDDFTSHDTLISYNVVQLFQNNQFTTTLNVAFNKMN